MSYAIVGFGKIGQALAHAFARKNIDVTVASRRPPEALAPQARAIGPTVIAKSLRDAVEADTIILAVPFGEHREVAKALPSWESSTRAARWCTHAAALGVSSSSRICSRRSSNR
jgi:8-hydroxy-5-deazaflavin:NADPH oxidoreductase